MPSLVFSLTALLFSTALLADEISVDMRLTDASGVGQSIGVIKVRPRDGGLEFAPDLKGLPPGPHGFHVHEKADCGPGEKDGKVMAGLAAGGHYDPNQTGQHLGPQGGGHKGDLPALSVGSDGAVTTSVVSQKLGLSDMRARALVIHAEPDNYGDKPGGARIACGVVK